MRLILDLFYVFVLKPSFLLDIIVFLIVYPVDKIVFNRLSSCLSVNRFTNTINMTISPIQLMKIWFWNKNSLKVLESSFIEGLRNLKKDRTYKTEVNKLFYLLMKRYVDKTNFPATFNVTEEYQTTQVLARIVLISPFHHWYYLITALLGNKKSRKKIESLFKKVIISKVTLTIK